eukprot:7831333-Prorocentrum_lima.AAC.1
MLLPQPVAGLCCSEVALQGCVQIQSVGRSRAKWLRGGGACPSAPSPTCLWQTGCYGGSPRGGVLP